MSRLVTVRLIVLLTLVAPLYFALVTETWWLREFAIGAVAFCAFFGGRTWQLGADRG